MKLKGDILDLCFRHILPEKLLKRIGERDFCPGMDDYRNWFLSVAEINLHGYSWDEQELFFRRIERSRTEFFQKRDEAEFFPIRSPRPQSKGAYPPPLSPTEGSYLPPFHLLAEYGDLALVWRNASPACRFEHTLNWRDAYYRLGQDIITTAWIAAEETRFAFRKQPFFSWPSVLPTDNQNLNLILEEGISENHCHLFGAAAVFALNWCRLMNYPNVKRKDMKRFEQNLQGRMNRGSQDNRMALERTLIYAAYIRALLFLRLEGEKIDCMDALRAFHALGSDGSRHYQLSIMADSLRFQYGVRFVQPDGTRPLCLDYAFTRELAEESESDSRILAGERFFLYRCFKACFHAWTGQTALHFNVETQWIFYLYLLLKSSFREEVVQCNRQIGFHNFQDYESRKYDLWNLPWSNGYWNEACRTAIVAPMREQPILSLELRLSPSKTVAENYGNLTNAERACAFYVRGQAPERLELKLRPDVLDGELLHGRHFFFVFHFIKEKDSEEVINEKNLKKGIDWRHPDYPPLPRHNALRKKIGLRAWRLAKMLHQNPALFRRVRGIDACSNEVGCPPETFAVAFRYLRTCPRDTSVSRPPTRGREERSLSLTYHVGEDFLDIVSGLRAIDETICFLDFRRGDRIGHALALGVNPTTHSSAKHESVLMPAQELLDNLVWLFFRCGELNIDMEPEIRERIRNRAEDLLTRLYRENLPETPYISLRDYYQSWLLRGDDPRCYGDGANLTQEEYHGEVFRPFLLNCRKERSLRDCRENSVAKALYAAYHCSRGIRNEGRKVERLSIDDSYIRLTRAVQRGMQDYVDSLGLSVECNPSSNALIGTFGGYENHPVFQFYTPSLTRREGGVQLHVSLNTDDQGVFETSLSFEYALVAAALTDRRDENGVRIYTDREIEDIIRIFQRMGNEQSFLDTVDPCH